MIRIVWQACKRCSRRSRYIVCRSCIQAGDVECYFKSIVHRIFIRAVVVTRTFRQFCYRQVTCIRARCLAECNRIITIWIGCVDEQDHVIRTICRQWPEGYGLVVRHVRLQDIVICIYDVEACTATVVHGYTYLYREEVIRWITRCSIIITSTWRCIYIHHTK